MNIDRRLTPGEPIAGPAPGSTAERRLQIERAEQERAAERQQQLALQSSPLSNAEERIRLWEQLHALKLPRSATHKLLRVIAEHTSLTIQQIHDEQRRRATGAASALSSVNP